MDDKVTDIYTDTANALRDLIGMSPSTFSEVYQILREFFPQAQEALKADPCIGCHLCENGFASTCAKKEIYDMKKEAPKAASVQDMMILQGAMDAQAERLAIKGLQDAIWIIDRISTGKESTKAIDLIKRVKIALETGELKIEPPCQPIGIQLAEDWLIERFEDVGNEEVNALAQRDAAQRQAGREERAADYAEHEFLLGQQFKRTMDEQAKRYSAAVEALKPFAEMSDAIGEARPSIQRETDNVYGFENVVLTLGDFHWARKALSDLDEARKG